MSANDSEKRTRGRWADHRTDAGALAQNRRSGQYQTALRRLRDAHAEEFAALLEEERGNAAGTD